MSHHSSSHRALFGSALAALGLASSARADVQPGDLLITLFYPGNGSRIEHVRSDGTSVASVTGVGTGYLGATLTNSGLYATTSRQPNAVRLFDPSGNPALTFLCYEITFYPGDIDTFSDGVLAVVDQMGDVDTYDETGAHQGHMHTPLLDHPFGMHVDAEDHVWLTDIGVTPRVFEFDRQGTPLQAFPLGFDPGDIDVDDDGTLWIADKTGHNVVHLTATGAPLGSFPVSVNGEFYGLGLNPDGTLSLAGELDDQIFRYSKQGTLLGSFPILPTGSVVFFDVQGAGEVGTKFCFGDGSGTPCPCANAGAAGAGCANSTGTGAALAGIGSTSAAADLLRFEASGLVPSQPVLLFSGLNQVSAGAGVAFGDGLRCVGGGVARLGVATASAGGSAGWGPGLISAAGWAAGDARRFQAWYRDPQASPCGASFNLSNGVELVLAP
jgi:hypothetical protein